MKLAFISSDRSLAVFGASGRSSFVREVLRAIAQHADQVQLFAARLDGDRPAGIENLRIHKLSLFGSDFSSDDSAMLPANRELRRMLDTTRGRFDGVFERFSPWCYAGVDYCRKNNIPLVLEITETGWEESLKVTKELQRVARETLEGASQLIAGSERLVEALAEQGLPASLIPGGIDPESYSTGARLGTRNNSIFTVGYLGSLENWEELLPLVNAFAQMHRKHPETRLLVEGDGPAKTQMITELSRRGLLGTACFLGRVSQRRIAGVLGAIDVAIALGSSSAIRMREIMLAGIPLLCCAQNEPALRHNVTAFCYQAGNEESLVQAMLTLYSDRILRMRLGSSARREVFREQNWDLIALYILNAIKPRLQPELPLPELGATSLQDSPQAAL